jgi:hypothetical protein
MTKPMAFPGRAQKALQALAQRPVWANRSVGNADAIQHWRWIGTVASAEAHESLTVEIVQRHELSGGSGRTPREGTPTEVLVAGVRLKAADARRLASLVAIAADTIEQRRPEIQSSGRDELIDGYRCCPTGIGVLGRGHSSQTRSNSGYS